MSPAYQSPNWTQVQRIERSRSNARMDVISRPFFGASPRLARVMEVEEAPWLAGALEELRALKAAGRDVPGLGDFRIAEETMDRARQPRSFRSEEHTSELQSLTKSRMPSSA